MLFALDYNDNRIHINETHSNQEYYCPFCGAPLCTKKGEKRQYHFAHKPNHLCSDTWEHIRSHSYDVSEWHHEWQSLFPKENQEIKLSLGDIVHRADIVIDRTVVEFQHSIMSVQAFDDRNNFYFNFGNKVVWLFDLSELLVNQLSYEKFEDKLKFNWKNPKKAFNNYDIQSGCIDLFFQLKTDADKCIVRVVDVSENGFDCFYATDFISKNEFLIYLGVENGQCLPPNRENVFTNENYQAFKEKYNIRLNKQQERALLAVEGSNLLLAVPGSGKTTVLVDRLGHMVINKGILPQNILAITYNKSAAEEMKNRFSSRFGENYGKQIDFRTINSLSNGIYCKYCFNKHTEPRKLISKDEQRNLLKQVIKEHKNKTADENDIFDLSTAISYIKNMMLTEDPDQIFEMEADIPNLKLMFESYKRLLKERKKMDFDDQMVFAHWILQNDDFIVNELRERYKYICVDEAQDTSKIQHAIIKILAQGNSLFMVGDEDQTIYGFRGAYPKALLNFRYDYLNPYILRMERNYRSTRQIVDKAQSFISQNKGRYEKNMVAERESGEDVSCEYVASREMQYLRLLEIAKSADSETAFLFRDNESSVVLVDLFVRNNIPFKLHKPEMNFFNNRIVKDIVAYLSLALNEYDMDSFYRICNNEILFLKNQQRDYVITNCKKSGISVYKALEGQMKYLKAKYQNRASDFRAVMETVRKSNTADAISCLMNSGYSEHLEKQHLDRGKIEILIMLAKHEPDLQKFLNRLKELEELIKQGVDTKESNAIILSTIHSSKGLEYDNVYMVDVYDGRFPSSQTNIFSRSKDNSDGEQEERRLFYVGITRAKNKLHFFDIKGKESSFIKELFPAENSVREFAQVSEPKKYIPVAYREYDRENSILDDKYKRLPTRSALTVTEMLNENYEQEDYIIIDILGCRRVKCTACGKIVQEQNIVELVKCNKGICIECKQNLEQ